MVMARHVFGTARVTRLCRQLAIAAEIKDAPMSTTEAGTPRRPDLLITPALFNRVTARLAHSDPLKKMSDRPVAIVPRVMTSSELICVVVIAVLR